MRGLIDAIIIVATAGEGISDQADDEDNLKKELHLVSSRIVRRDRDAVLKNAKAKRQALDDLAAFVFHVAFLRFSDDAD